tara:strand:+ start:295 stop:594 length:300 start_codon:yes stop_codon:yes gene_type:complete
MLKEGDLITGTELSSEKYGNTNEYMTKAEVLSVDGEEVEIIVLAHEYDEESVGEIFTVESKYFTLVGTTGVNNSQNTISGTPVGAPTDDYETMVLLGLV